MSNDNKEAKKEEPLEKQEARQLTEEELEQVTGGTGNNGQNYEGTGGVYEPLESENANKYVAY